MEKLIAMWKSEIEYAEKRKIDAEHKLGAGRNLYNDGMIDAFSKCIANLKAALKNKESQLPTSHNSESTPRCEACGMPLRLECTTPYCDNSIVP